jgi:hemoglobin
MKGVMSMKAYIQGNPYELIGGEETLRRLVAAFYPKVKAHPDLSPIFPEDLTLIQHKQYLFLSQFLGGPPLYSQEYGHPMLRARHMPFKITPRRAEAWLKCMSEAMDEIGLQGGIRDYVYNRLTLTAHHMINSYDEADE